MRGNPPQLHDSASARPEQRVEQAWATGGPRSSRHGHHTCHPATWSPHARARPAPSLPPDTGMRRAGLTRSSSTPSSSPRYVLGSRLRSCRSCLPGDMRAGRTYARAACLLCARGTGGRKEGQQVAAPSAVSWGGLPPVKRKLATSLQLFPFAINRGGCHVTRPKCPVKFDRATWLQGAVASESVGVPMLF